MKKAPAGVVVVVQALALCAVLVHDVSVSKEHRLLLTGYAQASSAIEAYADEVRGLRRENQRLRYATYIRSVNPSSPADEIAESVMTASEATGIAPAWLLAKLKQESYFNPRAVSATGCRGLAQICTAAAQDVGLRWEDAFKVRHNVIAGAAYLRMQLDATGGDMERALVRYNGGDDPLFVQKIKAHKARIEQ